MIPSGESAIEVAFYCPCYSLCLKKTLLTVKLFSILCVVTSKSLNLINSSYIVFFVHNCTRIFTPTKYSSVRPIVVTPRRLHNSVHRTDSISVVEGFARKSFIVLISSDMVRNRSRVINPGHAFASILLHRVLSLPSCCIKIIDVNGDSTTIHWNPLSVLPFLTDGKFINLT